MDAAPTSLRTGAGILLAQGVVLTLGSIVYIVLVATRETESLAGGEAAGVSLLLGGLVLVGLGLLLLRRRRQARGPSVALELFAMPVAYFQLQAGNWWIAVPLALLCVVAVVLLNTRRSLEWLGILTPTEQPPAV